MKKFILVITVAAYVLLPGCIANYNGITYETSNTMTADARIDQDKQTFNIFMSVRDNKEFQKLTKDIAKMFESWNNRVINTGGEDAESND